jgi:hypothetical protein
VNTGETKRDALSLIAPCSTYQPDGLKLNFSSTIDCARYDYRNRSVDRFLEEYHAAIVQMPSEALATANSWDNAASYLEFPQA